MRLTPRLFQRRLLSMFIATMSLLVLIIPFSPLAIASTRSFDKTTYRHTARKNVITQQPNQHSLLVVLLDRSGSLVDTPTDPDDYSTSVTRALTNLWPGKMVVITFPQVNPLVNDKVGQIGPQDLTDPTQRQTLTKEIPEPDPNGNTPLEPAMNTALNILQHNHPPGSQAILITDGLPNMTGDSDGTQEIADIEAKNGPLRQFRQLGIPIHTFGLQITDTNAQNLLNTIAGQTGGQYKLVQSSTDLALRVIQLYASWFNLQFQNATADTSGHYAVNINKLTSEAKILVFRSGEQYHITVTDPHGTVLQQGVGEQQSPPDPHYQIDDLDVARPVPPGAYNVFVGNDSQAQVYWLVETSLQVHIVAPHRTDVAYTGKPQTKITAALFDGDTNTALIPSPGAAVLQADVTFTAPGQAPSPPSEVDLTQQDGTDFSGNMPIYNTPGSLQIVVKATYEEIHQQSDPENVKVEIRPLPPCTTFQCSINRFVGYLKRNLGLTLGIGIFLLLLIALLFYYLIIWRNQQKPTGYLVNARSESKVLELGTHRPPLASIFKKSTVTMQELASHPDQLALGSLTLEPLAFVGTHTGVSLRALEGNLPLISVRNDKGVVQKFSAQQREIPLIDRDPHRDPTKNFYRSEILKDNVSVVTCQTMTPPKLIAMQSPKRRRW